MSRTNHPRRAFWMFTRDIGPKWNMPKTPFWKRVLRRRKRREPADDVKHATGATLEAWAD